MTVLRMLCLAALLAFGLHWWQQQRTEDRAIRGATDVNGFLPVPMPDGAQHNTVLLFAPLNCPREGTQRAVALAEKLTAAGIANVRTSHYGAQVYEPSDEQRSAFNRLDVVMRGEIPIALINGMGKANPTADEIISEFNNTQ